MNRSVTSIGLTAVVLLLYIVFPAGIFAEQPGGQAGAFLRMGLAPDRIARFSRRAETFSLNPINRRIKNRVPPQ